MEREVFVYAKESEALAAIERIALDDAKAIFVGVGIHAIAEPKPYCIPEPCKGGWAVPANDVTKKFIKKTVVKFEPAESEEVAE